MVKLALIYMSVLAMFVGLGAKSSTTEKGSAVMVKEFAEKLIDKDAIVAELITATGTLIEKGSSGYYIKPKDARLRSLFLGIGTDPAGREFPEYFEFAFTPEVKLKPADLAAEFGPWKRIPANPHGKPFRVVYDLKPKGQPFAAKIAATLSGTPASEETFVEKVSIRRDEQ